jgi:PAS domain S-box-containing protein
MPDSYTDIESAKALMHHSTIYYMISVGLDENISYVNEKYATNFNFIDNNLVGKPYHLTMHPDDMNICKEVGAKCFQNPDRSFNAIIRTHNGKGSYIVTLWDYRLIVKDGEPQGIFCIGHDITELEAKKKDIELLSEDLDKSHKTLDKVAYHQAHIVRAPLANILGLINLLKSVELDGNITNIVTMLEESSAKLDGVVHEIIKSTYR